MKAALPLSPPQIAGTVRNILFHLNMLRAEFRRVVRESA